MKLKVKKYDPQVVKPFRIHLCVGSVVPVNLAYSLIYYTMPNIDFAVGMAPTEETPKHLENSCQKHAYTTVSTSTSWNS